MLTAREPSEQERKNIEYGRAVARRLAEHDIGQTVVIAESACVAVEAMEGTDATIERAGQIMRSLHGDASTLSRALTVVKIAKPNQDMRFDVPVIGVKTIEVMQAAGASCLAVDAGKCLLLDGQKVIDAANAAGLRWSRGVNGVMRAKDGRKSEGARIADQLRRAFYGSAWHGPAVLELLKDVDAATAAAKPLAEVHSIWELVLHIAVWDERGCAAGWQEVAAYGARRIFRAVPEADGSGMAQGCGGRRSARTTCLSRRLPVLSDTRLAGSGSGEAVRFLSHAAWDCAA